VPVWLATNFSSESVSTLRPVRVAESFQSLLRPAQAAHEFFIIRK